MPKVKTKSAAKKRFKKVGSSKTLIKRPKAYRRHMLTRQTTKQKRHLRKGGYVSEADTDRILRLLPY